MLTVLSQDDYYKAISDLVLYKEESTEDEEESSNDFLNRKSNVKIHFTSRFYEKISK